MVSLYDDTISNETAQEWLEELGKNAQDWTTPEYRFQAWSVLRNCERKRRRIQARDPKTLTFADHRCLQAYTATRDYFAPFVGWGWLEGLD